MMDNFTLDPTLYDGRPADCTGRDAVETACYDFLDGLGVPYQRVDHSETPSIEACGEVEKLLGIEICKNLFLCNRQKTQFTLLIMPGAKPFRTKELSAQLGCSRLSFADEGHMMEYLGVTPGSVSVLGLLNDADATVRWFLDRALLEGDGVIGVHPNTNDVTVWMNTRDLIAIIEEHGNPVDIVEI